MAIFLFIFWRAACAAGLCVLVVSLLACSSFGGRSRQAALAAARDPWTWGPVAGAAVIATTGNDQRISQWAMNTTPVFGSREAASAASDRFRGYASDSAWLIFAAAPTQGEGSWLVEKGAYASSNLLGLALARTATGTMKSAAARERPNGSPTHDSFPSSHASDAFAHATLARYHTDGPRLNGPVSTSMQWASNSFAFATAWGRVEGGFHYPTDVLMGAALANFTTRFFMKLAEATAESNWQIRTRTDEYGKIIIEFGRPF